MDALWEQRTWAEGVVLNPGPLAPASHVLRAAVSASRMPVVEVLLAPAKGTGSGPASLAPARRVRGARRRHRRRGIPRGAGAAVARGEPGDRRADRQRRSAGRPTAPASAAGKPAGQGGGDGAPRPAPASAAPPPARSWRGACPRPLLPPRRRRPQLARRRRSDPRAETPCTDGAPRERRGHPGPGSVERGQDARPCRCPAALRAPGDRAQGSPGPRCARASPSGWPGDSPRPGSPPGRAASGSRCSAERRSRPVSVTSSRRCSRRSSSPCSRRGALSDHQLVEWMAALE